MRAAMLRKANEWTLRAWTLDEEAEQMIAECGGRTTILSQRARLGAAVLRFGVAVLRWPS